MVTAQSVVDTTTVEDTSKQDPFEMDPTEVSPGGAASPAVWMDYDWRIWVELGSSAVTIDSGIEPNDAGDQANGDTVANVSVDAEERGIPLDQLRGVFKVGGDANDIACDGFAFVELVSQPFETLASQIALALAILMLLILIMLAARGRSA